MLSYILDSRPHVGSSEFMTQHDPVSHSENVSQEADAGQHTTGEGSESALAVLRHRRDAHHLIAWATEMDADSTESSG